MEIARRMLPLNTRVAGKRMEISALAGAASTHKITIRELNKEVLMKLKKEVKDTDILYYEKTGIFS